MRNLRVGLVGLGVMGKHHARILANLEFVDFVGVCDPAGEFQGQAYGRKVVPHLEELIKMNLDYATVAVPTIHHLETGIMLAEAGVHALIEKPLAQDIESAIKLVDAFQKSGLLGAVGYIERFNPAIQEAKKRIEQLGTLYQVMTRRQGPFPERISDVGVIKDLATHDIDLTSWVTGQSYKSVTARMAYKSGSKNEDLVSINANLSEGAIATHLVNWLSPLKERVTTLTGEKGAFIIDTLTADLTFYKNGTVRNNWDEMSSFRGVTAGEVVRYAFTKKEPLRLEHENFRDAILGKNVDVVSLGEGLKNVRTIEAIFQSAKNCETLSLD